MQPFGRSSVPSRRSRFVAHQDRARIPTVFAAEPSRSARCARIETNSARLRLGGLVRLGQAEDHPYVRREFPVLQQTLALAAARHPRNVTNLDDVARQAGDFAQALVALDATIETTGSAEGPRRLPFAALHRQAFESLQVETSLEPGEVITFIDIPRGPWTHRSRYLKVRNREWYQFALTSAVVALHVEEEVIQEARIALGGVATAPWRAYEAEAVLIGHALDESLALRAAEVAFAQAHGPKQDLYKVPVGKHTLVRALFETYAMSV